MGPGKRERGGGRVRPSKARLLQPLALHLLLRDTFIPDSTRSFLAQPTNARSHLLRTHPRTRPRWVGRPGLLRFGDGRDCGGRSLCASPGSALWPPTIVRLHEWETCSVRLTVSLLWRRRTCPWSSRSPLGRTTAESPTLEAVTVTLTASEAPYVLLERTPPREAALTRFWG